MKFWHLKSFVAKKVLFSFDFDYFLDVRTPCLFGNVRAALTLMPKSIGDQ